MLPRDAKRDQWYEWLTDDSDKTFTHCGQVAVIVVQFILSNYWKKIIWQIHANFGASC